MLNRNELLDFWAQPAMTIIREKLIEDCPSPAEWVPGKSLEQLAGETELRRGYLLCLSNLGVQID